MGDQRTDGLGTLLQETKVRIKTALECAADTAKLVKFNPSSMLCAYLKGTDACNVSDDFLVNKN